MAISWGLFWVILACGAPSSVRSFQIPFLTSSTIASAPRAPPSTTISQKKANDKLLQDESEREARAKHDNDIFNALFVSVPERPEPVPYKAHGRLPSDFPPGALLRLGPNGAREFEGFLDGDGMIHCVTFPPNGTGGTYSNTYVDTQGRKIEKDSGSDKKYLGSLGAAPQGYPLIQRLVRNMLAFRTFQAQKDTCNTAIAEHGGKVLALMEQCPPSEIEIRKDGSIHTKESASRLNGAIPMSDPLTGGALSAHGRTCPITRDRIHVSYGSSSKPYVRVDTFKAGDGWNLRDSIGINTAAPVMVHDCAITSQYVVVFDFPLTVRPARLLVNRFPVEYEPSYGARIGLVPRNGSGDDTIWFDCDPGVILHAVNAYETNDGKVIVHALRSEPKTTGSFLSQYATSFLHEWTLDLKTGSCTEECLNPNSIVEFPVIDSRSNGMEGVDAVYCAAVSTVGGPLLVNKAPGQGILLDGISKLALADNDDFKKGDVVGRYVLPDDWYSVSEPTLVPKKGKDNGEYVLMIATKAPKGTSWQNKEDLAALKSQVLVLDGGRLADGPVWSADLPHHVPYGLHSCFVEWDKMQ